ncbi:OLC1v1021550C1 [Oldenlandia corymbosa var. corymbosa]|uniref:OLC1v1021550C1 n=1 Tax=Oldenlandia corymbosa var. corymbosa TaxID=529605 RepID=A0AAV1BVX3_OLDCO|nr:OLC1v1021550C1 [Oldenlandia corymbosa var. corymbosa]
MLGVFDRFTGKQPEELMFPLLKRPDWMRTYYDVRQFYVRFKSDSDITIYNFANGNFMSVSHKDELRTVMVMDDIFCMFFGTLDNLYDLRAYYGLSRSETEAMVVCAAYKVLRDRAVFSPDQVVREFKGNYAFMLFDTKSSRVFLARDRDGKVDLYWGTAADGSLVCSDDSNIIKGACGDCFIPFPPGCFFLSGYGLVSYDHPNNPMKKVERKDELGRIISAAFEVDLDNKVSVIPRCGSGDEWSLPPALEFNNWTLGPPSSGNLTGYYKKDKEHVQMVQGLQLQEVAVPQAVQEVQVNWDKIISPSDTVEDDVVVDDDEVDDSRLKVQQLAIWTVPSTSNPNNNNEN